MIRRDFIRWSAEHRRGGRSKRGVFLRQRSEDFQYFLNGDRFSFARQESPFHLQRRAIRVAAELASPLDDRRVQRSGADQRMGRTPLEPAIERFETLFSSDVLEGVACLADGLSAVVQEHAYWGGARDRIPLSQTQDMAPVGAPRVVSHGLHQRVTPHENICLIRSGQDWTATELEERRMYVEDVEPVLRAGMNFLRDEGLTVGCFANRYMTLMNDTGRASEKTFGMSWWKSLAALEGWAESHPTHIAIFGAAMKYLGAMGPAAKLKLYHEVTVAAADEQHFEYYNCHSRTGMLRAAGEVK